MGNPDHYADDVSQYYRIEIDQPATSTRTPKTWTFTPASNKVIRADVNLRREGKRISFATVEVRDPRDGSVMWPLANELPDPAFLDVPMRIYLSKPGDSAVAAKLIFDGKQTSMQPGWPAPSTLTMVAHDRSIDMRAQARVRALKNKTSVQLAQAIASEYGYTVDTSELGGIILTQRLIDIGMSGFGRATFSDWNHIVRALAVDGLELYVKGKVIAVRKLAQLVYPQTFRPDDGTVILFKPTINHVSSPGAGGQIKGPQPGGNKGTALSTRDARKVETDAEKADGATHRKVPQGPSSTNQGAHTESTGSNDGPAFQRRKRKDEAELAIWARPDLGLQHMVNMAGYGKKFDGTWHIVDMTFPIAGNGPTQQTMRLSREPQGGALAQAKVAAPGDNK